ncbi:MAG: nucleotide-binding protein [Chloroflexi bacterium]|nr:nucleotide-binding protein [Chloroflexota bacterium]
MKAIESDHETEETTVTLVLRIFIAHGGDTAARRRLADFIRALGAEPILTDREASVGRSVSAQVDAVMRSCHFGIALATVSRAATQDGRRIARGNVVNEIPRMRSVFGNRWMLMLQVGVDLPSNESEFVYERFSNASMENAFAKLVSELRAHRMLETRGISIR